MANMMHVETSRDNTWVKGKTYYENPDGTSGEFVTDWTKLTDKAWDNAFWYVGLPEKVAERCGIVTTPQRAKEFDDFLDGNLSGWYYAAYAARSTAPADDILVWILNTVSPEIKNRDWNLDRFIVEFPHWHMNQLLGLVKDHILSKSYAKDVFLRSLNGEDYYEVVRDLKYFQDSEAESFVDAVFSKNPDQVEKAKTDPKLVNWLVGQVMKEGRGKVAAPDVQEIVKARLG